MRTRFFTPQVVKTLVYVLLLITAAAIVFHYRQPASPSWNKSLLFAVKAITTSGVPDDISVELEYFLILYLPISVFAWAAMVDALVNRPPKENP